MAVKHDPASKSFIQDKASIGRWAMNELDRRLALDRCIEKHWANKSLGRIERIENALQWGWQLNVRRAGKAGPPDA